ncbi:Cyclic-di-GMP-binding biofilm dispersal mediator protein [Botrimarina colliarenosi]|uniref:Cyclic-di-GMP-binding biofilm dispersal mediator protein n=1 Tax=Botrimarina colliarenosi TaxID=2528001 RepID=A0A5C6AKR4_9BACT|nr:SDR family NAD(P)-dependent oxidoreductase [Botrimarina colliarenosi]TWT99765.1 Cyclic-di-GMP-binding biofilm dispersal mediator protein [Botrimarina colliarenosi]
MLVAMPSGVKKQTDTREAGKQGLITGGSAGLGLAIARAAAAQGMRLTLVGRDAQRLEAACEEISHRFPQSECHGITADLAVSGEASRVVAEASTDQPLDFVCHAAGLSARGRVVDTPRAEFERLMAINFFAAAELAAAVGERLAERGGRLVLIGSLATRVAPGYLGAYPASKHSLAALAQQLRMELGPQGLKTLLVCPGPIARDDAGTRYDDQANGLPESARRPGGGAKVKAIDPTWLAERILRDSRRGRSELVTPTKARLLFVLSQISPSLGDWLLRRQMKP